MDPKIFVINAGSSSVKYTMYLVHHDTISLLRKGQIDFDGGAAISWRDAGEDQPLQGVTRENAIELLLARIGTIDAFVHRIVMGGDAYPTAFVITDDALVELEALVPLAPLHQPHNISPILAIRRRYPALLQIGVPDNGFHSTISDERQLLAVARKWRELGVRVWGWHGLSYTYIAQWLAWNAPQFLRVVVAHLGSGASVCAVRGGRSVDTSMTFTPLAGLPGSTRSGTLDAAAALFMLRTLSTEQPELTPAQLANLLETELWKNSGLLGMSGTQTGDMRTLVASTDPDDMRAVNVFCNSAAKYIAQMVVSLGGIDALVFTGGIGEHAPVVRQSIVRQLSHLGFAVDDNHNEGNAERIESSDSKPVFVVPVDEEIVMARAAMTVLETRSTVAAE